LGRFAGDGLTEGASSLSELEEAMIGQVTEFENVEKLAKKRPTAKTLKSWQKNVRPR